MYKQIYVQTIYCILFIKTFRLNLLGIITIVHLCDAIF